MFSPQLNAIINNAEFIKRMADLGEKRLNEEHDGYTLLQLHAALELVTQGKPWKDPNALTINCLDLNVCNAAASFFSYLPLNEISIKNDTVTVEYIGYYGAEALLEQQYK
jgi:hypothetical protein